MSSNYASRRSSLKLNLAKVGILIHLNYTLTLNSLTARFFAVHGYDQMSQVTMLQVDIDKVTDAMCLSATVHVEDLTIIVSDVSRQLL